MKVTYTEDYIEWLYAVVWLYQMRRYVIGSYLLDSGVFSDKMANRNFPTKWLTEIFTLLTGGVCVPSSNILQNIGRLDFHLVY